MLFLLNVCKWKDEGAEKVPLVKSGRASDTLHPTLRKSNW
jgi:hypothetical protein